MVGEAEHIALGIGQQIEPAPPSWVTMIISPPSRYFTALRVLSFRSIAKPAGSGTTAHGRACPLEPQTDHQQPVPCGP